MKKETHCTQTLAVHSINFLHIRYGFHYCAENGYGHSKVSVAILDVILKKMSEAPILVNF